MELGDHNNDFIGNYRTKGCHAKNGHAFYGTEDNSKSASKKERIGHQTSLVEPNFRPNGYDCSTFTNQLFTKYSLSNYSQKHH